MSSLGQRGSVGEKVSIAGFLGRVGHLGGVHYVHDHDQGSVKSSFTHWALGLSLRLEVANGNFLKLLAKLKGFQVQNNAKIVF